MKNLLEIEERKKALKILRDADVLDFPWSALLIEKINEHPYPFELCYALTFFCMPGVHQVVDSSFLFNLYSKIIQAEKPFKMISTLCILKTLFRRHVEFFLEPQPASPHSVYFFTDTDNRLCYEIEGRRRETSWVIENTLDITYLENRREEIIRQLILNADLAEQSDEWVQHELTQNISEHPKAFLWALVLSKFNHLNLFETPERLHQLLGIIQYLDQHFYHQLKMLQLWMELPRERISLDLFDGLIQSLSEGPEHLDEFCRLMRTALAINEKNRNQDCLQGTHAISLIQQKEFLRMTSVCGQNFLMDASYDLQNYFEIRKMGA